MELRDSQETHAAAAATDDQEQIISVGETLRAARMARGLELSRIGQHLRIKSEFLQAIEERHQQGLPDQVYVLGFVRAYGDFLGLDGAALSRRYRLETSGAPKNGALAFPSPAPTGRIPGPIPLLVGLAAFGALAGAWLFGRDQIADVADLAAKAPAELMARLNAGPTEPPPPPMSLPRPTPPGSPSSNAAMGPVAAGPAAQPLVPPPAPPPTRQELTDHIIATAPAAPLAKLSTPEQDPNEETAPPAPQSLSSGQPLNPEQEEGLGAAGLSTAGVRTSEGKVYGQVTGDTRLTLKATAEVWVSIREADGQALLTKVLRPGDLFRSPNRPSLTLSTGDAGSLEVTVDGRPAPALGAKGQVVRLVRLDADKLKPQD